MYSLESVFRGLYLVLGALFKLYLIRTFFGYFDWVQAAFDTLILYPIHIIALHIRTTILPLIDTRVLHRPARVSIITHDILPLILSMLPRDDLARCCRVSQIFFHVAGKELYASRDGVLVGKRRYYRWYNEREMSSEAPKHILIASPKRTLLAGLKKPEEYDTSNVELRTKLEKMNAPLLWFSRRPPKYTPFLPSKLKLELLRNVRHIIYTTDAPKEFDSVDSTFMFPLFHTLTIQQVDSYARFTYPFLSNLRPKHIRLIHLPGFHNDYVDHPFPLDTPVCSRAEKVTIHLMNWEHLDTRIPSAVPPGIKQLDLVFMGPAVSDTRTGGPHDAPLQSFERVRPLQIPPSHHKVVASHLIFLLTEFLSSGMRKRIIGLGGGGDEAGSGDDVEEGVVDGEEQDDTFAKLLQARIYDLMAEAAEEAVIERLQLGGSERANEMLQRLLRVMGKVEFVSLAEYHRESDFLPF